LAAGCQYKTFIVAASVSLCLKAHSCHGGHTTFFSPKRFPWTTLWNMNEYVVLLRLGSQISPAVDDKWGPLEPARIFLDRVSAETYVRSLPLYWYRLRLLEYRIVELPLLEYQKWGSYFDEQ
jgi:hypothetical protein